MTTNGRRLGFAVVCLTALVGFTPPATADCSKVGKLLNDLGRALRTSRDTLASAKASSKAEERAATLRPKLESALAGCDLTTRLPRHPALAPFRDALAEHKGTPVEQAVRASWLHAELGVRAMLPDDDLCILFTRTGRRGRRACFKGQDGGVNSKNLRRAAKGWCVSRKAGTQSRQAGIETNKLAGLFEVPGLPTGFVDGVLNGLAASACPQTL